MPFNTPRIGIPYFGRGEVYSSTTDAVRMGIIDSSFRALWDATGDGIISGLGVYANSNSEIKIESGIAMVNGVISRLAYDAVIPVGSSGAVYIRKKRSFGGYGLFSNPSSFNAFINPSMSEVGGAVSVGEDGSVTISWNKPIWCDFIRIYRNVFGDVKDFVGFSYGTSLVDQAAPRGVDVEYFISAVQKDGIINGIESLGAFSIPPSDLPPPPLSNPTCIQLHKGLGVHWDVPASPFISSVDIVLKNINGTISSAEVSAAQGYYAFSNLEVGLPYYIELQSVSSGGVSSPVRTVYGSPIFSQGPNCPINPYATIERNATTNSSFIKVNWTNPVTTAGNADPNSPGQVDDATNQYTAYNIIQIVEIASDGITPNFTGEEFSADSPSSAEIEAIRYRSANGELLVRSLRPNTRYVISIRRMVNGWYSPPVKLSIKTGNLGSLVAPSSGSALVRDDGSILATWSVNPNSSATYFNVSLSSASVLSRTRVYSNPPRDVFGIVRSYINVFDFIKFDFSNRKIRIRVVPTTQLSSFNFSILNQQIELDLTDSSTMRDIELFFNKSINIFSLNGVIYSLNQLFTFVSLDSEKPTLDIVSDTNVSPSFITWDSQDPNAIPSYDPSTSSMSLIEYYIYYYGGCSIKAVDDIETATYVDTVQLGQFVQERIGIGGEFNIDVAGNAYETEKGFLRPNRRYRFSVSSVDVMGNYSTPLQFYADSPSAIEITPPIDPYALTAEVRGGTVSLLWTPSPSEVSQYVIYRKTGNGDFLEVARIPKTENTFVDVGVSLNVNITYVVKVIDVWGNSLSLPDNYNYTQMTYAVARITGADFNDSPISASASASGFNSVITWSASDVECDGYEIWVKRPGELYSLVATVSSSQLSYTHQNALIKEGLWSYVVRPVRGELEVNIASSDSLPLNAFVLANVSYDENGDIQIENASRSIAGGGDILFEAISPRISGHRHLYLPDGQDRRINLDDFFELTNFISLRDGIRFTHVQEHPSIPEGAVLNVYINGEPYAGNFTYNQITRTITFSSSVLKPNGPYDVIDSISLRVSNSYEVTNQLEPDSLIDLYGEQMSSGLISDESLPELTHSGRRSENCKPLLSLCSSLDGFKFVVSENEYKKWRFSNFSSGDNSFIELGYGDDPPPGFEGLQRAGFPLGDERHVIVYDGCELYPDDSLILATSIGVVKVSNISTSLRWEVFIPCNPPNDIGMPHRMAVSADRSAVAIAYPKAIDIIKYVQSGSDQDSPRELVVVANAIGIDYNIKFIRDVCSAGQYFFLASDIGPILVSISEQSTPYASLMSLPDSENSESYACAATVLDSGLTTLYVSTRRGVYYTSNYGETWSFLCSTTSVVRSIKIQGDLIYLLTDDSLIRYSINLQNSKTIFKIENNKFRRMEIFSNRILLIGNSGCLINDIRYSIMFSPDVPFIHLKGLPKFGRKTRAARSMFKYKDSICVGGDAFISRGNVLNRIRTMVDFSLDMLPEQRSRIPTVFTSNIPQECGSYLEYSPNRNSPECVYFDDQVEGGEDVKIARQYHSLQAVNGGWAWRDFSAPIVVKINKEKINDGSRAEKPVDQLLDLVSESGVFSDLFSNSIKANSFYGELTSVIAEMTNNDVVLSDSPQAVGVHRFTRANVRRYVSSLNNLNSQIYSDEAMRLLGTRQSIQLKSPEFKTKLVANFVTNGVSKLRLDAMGVAYTNYGPETCVGNLGTYDPEDGVILIGEIPTTPPPDGSDDPIYPDPSGQLSRPPLPNPSNSALISGYFSRPCSGNDECPPSGNLIPPSASGSLGGFGDSNGGGGSGNPPVEPPPGGGLGGGAGAGGGL